MTDGGDGNLIERTFIPLFDPGGRRGRKQLFVTERERGKGNVHGKLRLESVAEIAAGRPHRHVGQGLEKGALLAGRRFRAGRSRDDGDTARARRETLPHPRERGGHCTGWAARALRHHGRESRQRLCAARLRVPALFQDQECAERAEHHAAGAIPDRPVVAAQHVSAGVVEQQQVLTLAVVRAAHQRDVALPGGNARERDAHRIDPRRFLAHEGARRADDAMDDRDIAGEQVGQLRQEQRRPQIAHQPLVEEGAGIGGLPAIGQDRAVDRDVALAAAGGDDHVHAAE